VRDSASAARAAPPGAAACDRRAGPTATSGGRPHPRAGVLPLTNLAGDPEQEYFADGMTEALIAELAQVARSG